MKRLLQLLSAVLLFPYLTFSQKVYNMEDYGVRPGSTKNISGKVQKALEKIVADSEGKAFTISFVKGVYHFYPKQSFVKEYYISNHDQTENKSVGIALENLENVTLEGNGSEFIYHGTMLPISLVNSKGCTLKNFSIDFSNPQISQVSIVNNDSEKGITFEVAPWVKSRVSEDNRFEAYGTGWSVKPGTGIAFDGNTRHLVYRTSDLSINLNGVKKIDDRTFLAPNWKDSRLVVGTIVALRDYGRPAPGIFISHSSNSALKNIKVHYAYGMGLLAQMSENLNLDSFNVCLRGDDDPRYFTTQADATHFSGCKGVVNSVNGLYEGMMDDAINIHGTYLKIVSRLDDKTFVGRYMHPQAWGFDWGYKNDSVQFVKSNTMEIVGDVYTIADIQPYDKETVKGAKEFKIIFNRSVEGVDIESDAFGIENLTWSPEVYFADNIIRNNRARGSLFSTPRKTIVENNLFDHTSGAAILLCGDCNGWYETGACRDIVIRNNKFINALTNMFQFTNAVISIYPEIPNLGDQIKFFHGGKRGAITIEDNIFEMFDAPVLYAKSVDGIIFRNNVIKKNDEFKPFHWNNHRFLFEKVTNVEID